MLISFGLLSPQQRGLMMERLCLKFQCPECSGHGYSRLEWPIYTNFIVVKVSCEPRGHQWYQTIINGRSPFEECVGDYAVDIEAIPTVPTITRTEADAFVEALDTS
ncbi:MAG: hypothetical protein CMI53_00540 [Parcubacteria group bacterium]|nr:hypothetical protein [Parcubacteria group bacterium]|tara:strand:+ start:552 stop:869 length:318 start_codon:yes stop_codon:yes gene_type:complete